MPVYMVGWEMYLQPLKDDQPYGDWQIPRQMGTLSVVSSILCCRRRAAWQLRAEQIGGIGVAKQVLRWSVLGQSQAGSLGCGSNYLA